jgi:hypothetical protein
MEEMMTKVKDMIEESTQAERLIAEKRLKEERAKADEKLAGELAKADEKLAKANEKLAGSWRKRTRGSTSFNPSFILQMTVQMRCFTSCRKSMQ